MNAGYVKLILAALWLVPGVGLLASEWWTGRAIVALPLGTVRIPLSWVFLMFGGFNLLRWWAGRTTRASADRWARFRNPPRRRDRDAAEPDPNFRFEDGPR
jgi:hypothetical protein